MKHLYLIQTPAALPASYEFLRNTGRDFLILSYREKTSDTAIFFPNSTWTSGRNKLREHVIKLGLEKKYDYLTFLDDDISFANYSMAQGFQRFEELLEEYQPFIGNPELENYYLTYGQIPVDVQSTIWFDGIMNAFSRDAFESALIFPYYEKFDSENWWMSQYAMIIKCSLYYPQRIALFNNLKIRNLNHSEYPRTNEDEIWNKTLNFVYQNIIPFKKVNSAAGMAYKKNEIDNFLNQLFKEFETVRHIKIDTELTTAQINSQLREKDLLGKLIHVLTIIHPRKESNTLENLGNLLRDTAFVIVEQNNKSIKSILDKRRDHKYLLKAGFILLTKNWPMIGENSSLYFNPAIITEFNAAWGVFPDRKDFVELKPSSNELKFT